MGGVMGIIDEGRSMTKNRVYVASSWRNPLQQSVVQLLRSYEHLDVYDFRNPAPCDNGFRWSEIDPDWKQWSPEAFRDALGHPVADRGFGHDMRALSGCDSCLLVLPCGRSAHLELGQACGAGKRTAVYMPHHDEPELMYKMCGSILVTTSNLRGWAEGLPTGLTRDAA